MAHPDLLNRESHIYLTLCQNNVILFFSQFQFQSIVDIGRDFLRLLREGRAHVPVLKEIWMMIVNQPHRLDKSFKGISRYILKAGIEEFWEKPTSKELITSRVTPDLQFKINFLLTHVTKPLDKPFFERLRKRYLIENEQIIPDIIRYIIRAVHPSNQILASSVVQRWEIIYRLLLSIRVYFCYI